MAQTKFRPEQLKDLIMTYGKDRQAIINGNFDVWQRGSSFGDAGYSADRWYLGGNAVTGYSATRQSFTVGQTDVPNNPKYFINFGGTGSGGVAYLAQKIEDVTTFSGKTITISFWAKSTDTTSLLVDMTQYFGSGGSTTVSITGETKTISSSWGYYTLTVDIPSVSGKTITSNDCLNLFFRVDTFTTQIDVDIAQVQINVGSFALPFSPKSYQEELALCQRYYERLGGASSIFVGVGQMKETTGARVYYPFRVTKRKYVATNVSAYSDFKVGKGSATYTGTAWTSVTTGKEGAMVELTIGTALTIGDAVRVFTANSTGYMEWDAEL